MNSGKESSDPAKTELSQSDFDEIMHAIEEFRQEDEESLIKETGFAANDSNGTDNSVLKYTDEVLENFLAKETEPMKIRITDDSMAAYLTLREPEDGVIYSKTEVMDFINQHGISYGYIQSNIVGAIKKKIYDSEILIAEGKPVTESIQGHFEYLFETDITNRKPKVREDGSVDYSNMSSLENVHKDDVIAVYRCNTPGISGYDIFGREMKPRAVRELPPLRGRGFYTKKDDLDTYYAIADGKIEYKDGRVEIREIHYISGDVTYITEKVEFFGDIVITGNVMAGVSIRAGKSLTINGYVERCQIFAGGDIILKRGIQGAGKAVITCWGNVYADFIENTIVKARGNLRANYILNSFVESEGKVVVSGKRGSIIGGYIHGLKGVEATIIGNPSEVRTVVHVGNNSELIEEWKKVCRREIEIKEELELLVKDLSKLVKDKKLRGISKHEEERLRALSVKKDEVMNNLDTVRESKQRISNMRQSCMGAKVRADGNIYRGTIIQIDGNFFPLENSTCYMEYFNVDGVLNSKVIIKN